MNRMSKLLIIFLFLLIGFSVGYSFYDTVVKQDFVILNSGEEELDN